MREPLVLLREAYEHFDTLSDTLKRPELPHDIRFYIENEILLKLPVERQQEFIGHSGAAYLLMPDTIEKLFHNKARAQYHCVLASLNTMKYRPTFDQFVYFFGKYKKDEETFHMIQYFADDANHRQLAAEIVDVTRNGLEKYTQDADSFESRLTELKQIFTAETKVVVQPFSDNILTKIVQYYKDTTSLWQKEQATDALRYLPITEDSWNRLWTENDMEPIRTALATNPNIPDSMVQRLSTRFSNTVILASFTRNPKCPPTLLLRYSMSHDQTLANRAKKRLEELGALTQAPQTDPEEGEGGEANDKGGSCRPIGGEGEGPGGTEQGG